MCIRVCVFVCTCLRSAACARACMTCRCLQLEPDPGLLAQQCLDITSLVIALSLTLSDLCSLHSEERNVCSDHQCSESCFFYK